MCSRLGERIGIDADQAEHSRGESLDLVSECLCLLLEVELGCRERTDDVERYPGTASRREDGEPGAVPQRTDVGTTQIPGGETFFQRSAVSVARSVGGLALPLRLTHVHPRLEIGWRQVGERQQQIGHVPLGIEDERGNPAAQRLFEVDHAESGLAGSGHTHDHSMCREVIGVVVDELVVLCAFAGVGVDDPAEIEALAAHGAASW